MTVGEGGDGVARSAEAQGCQAKDRRRKHARKTGTGLPTMPLPIPDVRRMGDISVPRKPILRERLIT